MVAQDSLKKELALITDSAQIDIVVKDMREYYEMKKVERFHKRAEVIIYNRQHKKIAKKANKYFIERPQLPRYTYKELAQEIGCDYVDLRKFLCKAHVPIPFDYIDRFYQLKEEETVEICLDSVNRPIPASRIGICKLEGCNVEFIKFAHNKEYCSRKCRRKSYRLKKIRGSDD